MKELGKRPICPLLFCRKKDTLRIEKEAMADVKHLFQDKIRAAGLGFSWSGTTGNLITAYTEG